ncbi:MAG: imidazole glycerol phosphate synthase subunit HisH [Gammaproteobacteria bacterium TMED257]|nr:MAG: imidazole glycerol phosphate synthase subunit HisH [Gammaproteobacteria bacterium TMED257]|tara:strand:+ start:6002 stop:6637 length:636 start_codon:yes stop_codon:yes gene_type:complete
MADIVIIDYGMGNVHSVFKALDKIADKRSHVKISNSLEEIKKSSHIVFPGQGAASECMLNISRYLDVTEFKKIINKKPFLGICMGLQVLMTASEENNGADCLDIIDGRVCSFENRIQDNYKIPHMGWSEVMQTREHPIWNNIPDKSFFYFVHSYFVDINEQDNILSKTSYGLEFTSSLFKNNIVAVQFHPEKSSSNGLRLLENFIKWDGQI